MMVNKHKPTLVAIYGSSLFLTAVATLFMQDERYQPIFFSETTALSTILHCNPALLLYQEDTPPTDIPVLLAAGLIVAEIMPDKDQMTISQRHVPKQCVAVCNSVEFQTKIIPFIAVHQQKKATIFNKTSNANKGIHP